MGYSLLSYPLWALVETYDKVVYLPLATAMQVLLRLPPKVPSPIEIQAVRLAMLIPFLIGIAASHPWLACLSVLLHDLLLAHMAGVASEMRKTKGDQDDPPLVTFAAAFVGKLVNAIGVWTILITSSYSTMTPLFGVLYAGVLIAFLLYALVDISVRVVDYFPSSQPHDQGGYGRLGAAGAMVAFSVLTKIQEKIDSVGLALLCLYQAEPQSSTVSLVVMAAFAVSMRLTHRSLAHKFMVKRSRIGEDVHKRQLERLRLQSPIHQDAALAAFSHDRKYEVAYSVGCFDLFHDGHIRLLLNMRELASRVVVGVHDDESIYHLKNRYPMDNTVKRMRNVKAFADVVWCVPSTNPTPYLDCIIDRSTAKRACYIRGNDMPNFPGRELVEKLVTIELLPYTEGVSSTAIRAQLMERTSLNAADEGELVIYKHRWIRVGKNDEWLRYGDIWVRYPSAHSPGNKED
eukprot:a676390_54.p1 GENE.a676390_54~~a676390_54.p1  ORF type:complete len:469 (-),score=175.85 a676390_54:145-1524(-)